MTTDSKVTKLQALKNICLYHKNHPTYRITGNSSSLTGTHTLKTATGNIVLCYTGTPDGLMCSLVLVRSHKQITLDIPILIGDAASEFYENKIEELQEPLAEELMHILGNKDVDVWKKEIHDMEAAHLTSTFTGTLWNAAWNTPGKVYLTNPTTTASTSLPLYGSWVETTPREDPDQQKESEKEKISLLQKLNLNLKRKR